MKNENFKLILVAFMLTIGICTLIYLGNIITPEQYKFNVEIWGTVNDWMMYSVGIVTAVFLYKTLRSQQEVQKMQMDMKEIETHKFRDSLRPNVIVTHTEFEPITSIVYFTLSIQDKSLKHPRFISPLPLKFNSQISVEQLALENGFLYIINDYISPEDKRGINVEVEFDSNTWTSYNDLGGRYLDFYQMSLFFKYSDIKNFQYENLLIIIIKPTENYIKVSLGDADFQ
ncbi:hypothetical protein [Sphingobacterium sp. UGAL515B_05]|uniref:hypothetical protein n=1 Tax=Sphingobacterium sp. UGAL515B_05 TaxID=2986767 RepID=UPI0029555FA2|nr:hypothetical protein [Sphingobacterium sp. UGAL515B_05]WON92528.1 hypothetical protein OK025_14915 [Sphingobacterium sp. UGAL515B_05]